LVVEKLVHDLPHPGLLPKEKEKRTLRLAEMSNWIGGTQIWIGRIDVRTTDATRRLFPLLGGTVRVRANLKTNFAVSSIVR
jgi:hypothetical protein